MLVERQPTPVLFVACEDEIEAIRAAWERLEDIVPLRGRRFFGAAYADGSYRACIERRPGEAGGSLEEGELRGEPPAVYDGIAAAFDALETRAPRDATRPHLEHYRRRDEIDVLLPVRGG